MLLVQQAINRVAPSHPGSLWRIVEDGVFGNQTRDAVMAFQRIFGLTVDGIVGPITWERLMREAANVGRAGVPLQIEGEDEPEVGGQVEFIDEISPGEMKWFSASPDESDEYEISNNAERPHANVNPLVPLIGILMAKNMASRRIICRRFRR